MVTDEPQWWSDGEIEAEVRALSRRTVTYPTTRDDALSLLRAERDENTCRKNMTPEELIDMTTAIEEMTKTDNAAKRTGWIVQVPVLNLNVDCLRAVC